MHADNVYIVEKLEDFWQIHKKIREKPCCFLYSYERLDADDMAKIRAERIVSL